MRPPRRWSGSRGSATAVVSNHPILNSRAIHREPSKRLILSIVDVGSLRAEAWHCEFCGKLTTIPHRVHMVRQQFRSDWTLASWVFLAVGTILACSLPFIDARSGVLANMWQTLAAMVVGLLALTSGVAGIVSGLFGEAATKTAGATSAMAAVWANVVFLLGFVAILLIRTS